MNSANLTHEGKIQWHVLKSLRNRLTKTDFEIQKAVIKKQYTKKDSK